MRKRHQKGSLTKVGRVWIAQWREEGHRRKRTLGLVSQMTKSEARLELDAIVAPINSQRDEPKSSWEFDRFVEKIYFPFYDRKWKESTSWTNHYRINSNLVSEFSGKSLGSFERDDLQGFLDRKVSDCGQSFSSVDHLRWDLKQIFRMAVAEGYLERNPASLLFTPRQAARPQKRVMTWKEVGLCLTVLDLREELICAFAIIAGMRQLVYICSAEVV
jgi:hypothetical protein